MTNPKPLDLNINMEEILNRYEYLKGDIRREVDFEDGFMAGISEMKQRIKSALEFYERYKDDLGKFLLNELTGDEEEEFIKIWKKSEKKARDWLLKYAFKGVFE